MSEQESNISRYARQEIFRGIGSEGQKKIAASTVAIIGLSGLGTITAEQLTRAGVGTLRLIDGDYADFVELQRLSIFTEKDAREEIPKAAAAKAYLEQINSDVVIEEAVTDVNSGNIDHLLEDVDLVIDASDSMEMRLLINEACHVLEKPWIYGGALASEGMTCNFLPGPDQPCLKCFLGDEIYEEDEDQPTCATVGVINSTIGTIASLQSAEALKILTGSPKIRKEMVMFDLWDNTFDTMPVDRDPECPVCGKEIYQFYGKAKGSKTVSLCGKDSVQIVPEIERTIHFDTYARKLEAQGTVRQTKYTLDFDDGNVSFKLFRNGRAIIKHVTDLNRAKAIYSEYIGI